MTTGGEAEMTKAMTECEAADLLGMKVATLRAWRSNKKGPPFLKFGRAVRYSEADLERFMACSRVDTGDGSVPDMRNDGSGRP